MADNKMPFVTSKALKKGLLRRKKTKTELNIWIHTRFSFKFDKVTGKFVNGVSKKNEF